MRHGLSGPSPGRRTRSSTSSSSAGPGLARQATRASGQRNLSRREGTTASEAVEGPSRAKRAQLPRHPPTLPVRPDRA